MLASALLLLAGSLHAAGIESLRAGPLPAPAMDPPPPISGRAVADPTPPWMTLDGEGPEFQEAKTRVLKALRMVFDTPSGRDYERILTRDGGTLRIESDWAMQVSGTEIAAGIAYMREKEDWQLAFSLAHELEHVRQALSGMKDQAALSVREAEAELMQARVWVELGGKVRDSDWGNNMSGSRDMAAWLEYPISTLTAMLYRSGHPIDVSRPELQRYWDDALSDDRRWRDANRERFPKGLDSKDAAVFILEQAARFGGQPLKGKVSGWLPAQLELASRLGAGGSLTMPGDPSDKDLAFLRMLPGVRVQGRTVSR